MIGVRGASALRFGVLGIVVFALACGTEPMGSDGGTPIPDGAVRCTGEMDPACPGRCLREGMFCIVDCSTPDMDGDGEAAAACGGGDCDDFDPTRFPGNVEVCDPFGVDEDCDLSTFGMRDADGDGFVDARCCNGDVCATDCNDAAASARPDGFEVCDATDNDCDGAVDEGVTRTFTIDNDGDRFGDSSPGAETREACLPPARFVEDNTDCDDGEARRNPGAPEVCDDVADNDCNPDTNTFDEDGDGFDDDDCGGNDCRDEDPTRFPGATEICDGVDQNCDGRREDDDLDRHLAEDEICEGGELASLPRDDCDDERRGTTPGNPDYCNTIDDDCDGTTDEDGPEPFVTEPFTRHHTQVDESTAFAPSGTRTETLTLRDGFSNQGIGAVPLEIYADRLAGEGPCAGGCQRATTSFDGNVSVMLDRGAGVALRVPAGEYVTEFGESVRVLESVAQNWRLRNGLVTFSRDRLTIIADRHERTLDPETGHVMVYFNSRELQGRVVDEAGVPVCEAIIAYDRFSAAAPYTQDSDPMYVLNLPAEASGSRYIIEAWGRLRAGGPVELVARHPVDVRPDQVRLLEVPLADWTD